MQLAFNFFLLLHLLKMKKYQAVGDDAVMRSLVKNIHSGNQVTLNLILQLQPFSPVPVQKKSEIEKVG